MSLYIRRRQAVAAATFLALLTVATASQAQPTFSESGGVVLGVVDFNSRSASTADFDGDGDLDLFFQGAAGAQQLFRNNLIGAGVMTYTNVSGMLPSGVGSSWSAAWGDYDGDRQVDVFIGQTNFCTGERAMCCGITAPLASLTKAAAVGLDDPGFHQNVAWSDIDNDNDLDLILAMEGPEKHEIYLQGSDGLFTPVGALVGFQEDFRNESLRHGNWRHRRRRRSRHLYLNVPQQQQHPQQLSIRTCW